MFQKNPYKTGVPISHLPIFVQYKTPSSYVTHFLVKRREHRLMYGGCTFYFKDIDKRWHTERLAMWGMQYFDNFRLIREDILTDDFLVKMILRYPDVLRDEFIASFLSENVLIRILRERPWLLSKIKHQTYKMCQEALKIDGLVLRFVRIKTKELCRIALNQNPTAIRYIKNKRMKVLCYKYLSIERSYSFNKPQI